MPEYRSDSHSHPTGTACLACHRLGQPAPIPTFPVVSADWWGSYRMHTWDLAEASRLP
jgi:hypothetical protein